jgi:hypothetical protein
MDPRVLDAVLVAAPVAAWFGVFGLALAATRPETPQAAPASADLGPEPPAIVSMLANHWEITEDAAESTLLDLAARHILEFRQPGNDPRQTTVHVKQPNPVGLSAYEQRIFDRVAGLAVGGVIPLTALTFRDADQAKAWAKRLSADVVAQARERGLSRRRFGPPIVTGLVIGAGVVAFLVGAGVAYWLGRSHSRDTVQTALFAAGVTFVVLSGHAARPRGDRDTAAGRAAASRWFGVRAWLRGHEEFGDLPPAAVTVWDRYLSYGAAVGVTRVSSAVIDLGMGNRKHVWSCFGGTWHRVRVRYPRFWPRYGRTAARLAVTALIVGVVGFFLIHIGILAGAVLVAYALYTLVRTSIDISTPVTLTGEVVWTEVWRTSKNKSNDATVPWLHYLAVDDGRGDTIKAWGLPSVMSGSCGDGDTVTMIVRRWSRRVMSIQATKRGGAQRLATAGASVGSTAETIAESMGIPGSRVADGPLSGLGRLIAPLAPTGPLLTPDEVGAALGVPVTLGRTPGPGAPIEITEYRGPDGSPVLTVARSGGMVARLAIRSRRQGQQLAGIGDEARGGPGWIVARRGDSALMMHLAGAAVRSTPPANLMSLAQSAVGRLPAPPAPVG